MAVLVSTGKLIDGFTYFFVFFVVSLDFLLKSIFFFLDGGLRYDVFLLRLITDSRSCHDSSKSLRSKSSQELSLSPFIPSDSFRIMLLWFKVFFILVQILLFLISVFFTADSTNCLWAPAFRSYDLRMYCAIVAFGSDLSSFFVIKKSSAWQLVCGISHCKKLQVSNEEVAISYFTMQL